MTAAADDRGRDVLTVEGVTVALSGRPVLDRVSFSVAAGSFTGLIGSNGAGKTTLLRVVLGLLRPASGRVLLDGRQRRGPIGSVGYVPQRVALDPDLPMRARDLVALGLDGHRYGLRRRTAEERGRVEEVLVAVGAERFADLRVGRLSGGEQQRVLIAHALVSRPRLLLLDEPLANLDLSAASDVVALLHRVVTDYGVAVVLSAHEVNALLPVTDRVVYLAGGHAVSGTVDDVIRSDVLTALYGSPIEVLRVAGRVLVVAGGGRDAAAEPPAPETPAPVAVPGAPPPAPGGP